MKFPILLPLWISRGFLSGFPQDFLLQLLEFLLYFFSEISAVIFQEIRVENSTEIHSPIFQAITVWIPPGFVPDIPSELFFRKSLRAFLQEFYLEF